MKKSIFVIFVALLLFVTVYAADGQALDNGSNVLKVKFDKEQGLYGYVDAKGNWVIGPRFENAREFSEGAAAVVTMESGWKAGYIRPDGTFLIEPGFEGAFDFIDGFAVVTMDGLAGTIDKNGNFILQPKYYLQGANNISKKVRAVITDKNPATGTEVLKYGMITAEGKLIEPRYDGQPYIDGELITFFIEDSTKQVDKRRNFIIFPNGKEVEYKGEIKGVSEGVRRICFEFENGRYNYGFLTEDGTMLDGYVSETGKRYPLVEAKDFSEGVAAVAINDSSDGSKRDSWGYIKKDGTWLLKPDIKGDYHIVKAGSFKEGLAPILVKDLKYWMYIDKTGAWVIKPKLLSEADVDSRYADNLTLRLYTKEEYDYTVKKAAEACSRLINGSMSDYEKLVKIHDYIVDNFEYSYETLFVVDSPRIKYTAYSAFKYGDTVCQGYAEALGLMLTMAGVENELVIGFAGDVKNAGPAPVNHAWNLVKLDGNYYHVDATWDDDKKESYKYFLVSDEFMSQGRIWNRNLYPAAPKSYSKR